MEPLETKGSDSFRGSLSQNAGTPIGGHATPHDEDFDGRELSRFAADKKLTPEQVWEKIKSGQLVARCHQGRMYVLENLDQMSDLMKKVRPIKRKEQPQWNAPFDGTNDTEDQAMAAGQTEIAGTYEDPMDVAENFTQGSAGPDPREGGYLATRPLSHPPEIALLLDHLSLAKEENKDILKLTQNAISQITSMTNSMLSLKEELLTAKDDQLKLYKQHMDAKELQLNMLKQEVEDLKMLTRFLSPEP